MAEELVGNTDAAPEADDFALGTEHSEHLTHGEQNEEGRRVKVYELRAGDWKDLGTGNCYGDNVNTAEPTIYVEEEGNPGHVFFQMKVVKDDTYNRQQETLIVWTEPGGLDMALSFQEADGCAAIWKIIHDIQQLHHTFPNHEDNLSDEIDQFPIQVALPSPLLSNLGEIEAIMRNVSTTMQGRDYLTKLILTDDFLPKLVPLIEMAEDFEGLSELHRLSNIMKIMILLNDSTLIEALVEDPIVMGVMGALEYDPEFPHHKANHRAYLKSKARFKEVIEIKDPAVKNKIHCTWRLQYLKDVVLARILDDSTFGVLNTLIFFNQVDIVNYLQAEPDYIRQLFAVDDRNGAEPVRRRDAVRLIQQCCAVAKNLQTPARHQLYANFVSSGLVKLVTYALRQKDAATRVAGMDILMNLLEQDAAIIRNTIMPPNASERGPLLETIIGIILGESEIGVRGQGVEALKIILDPQLQLQDPVQQPLIRTFIDDFYNRRAKNLFSPLQGIQIRLGKGHKLTHEETQMCIHLLDLLIFFLRGHSPRVITFIAENQIMRSALSLLHTKYKHLQLAAVKFFRACVGTKDETWLQQLAQHEIYPTLLDLILKSPTYSNCLKSSLLDFFMFIRHEDMKNVRAHLVDNYRTKLLAIHNDPLFPEFVENHERYLLAGSQTHTDDTVPVSEDAAIVARIRMQSRFGQGMKDLDPLEQRWFDADDDDDEDEIENITMKDPMNTSFIGLSGPRGLVDYPDDEDDDDDDDNAQDPLSSIDNEQPEFEKSNLSRPPSRFSHVDRHSSDSNSPPAQSPPSRLSEKRLREEDEEEDQLGKLTTIKRRSSTSSASSIRSEVRSETSASLTSNTSGSVNASSDGSIRNTNMNGNRHENGGGALNMSMTSAQLDEQKRKIKLLMSTSPGGKSSGKKIAISLGNIGTGKTSHATSTVNTNAHTSTNGHVDSSTIREAEVDKGGG